MLSNFRSVVQQTVRGISLLSRVNKKFTIKDNNEFVDKVLNSRVPVIVTFHAEWCDPCKILTPKLEELVEPLNDLHLAIVDVESNPELVHTFEVKAVPAVIAVSNGLVVDKFIGLVEANMIENLIQKLLKKDSKDQKT
ncbi:thioredoxin, mitochondrial isoform X1 [Leptopilina boulardi]|uniref:thioredoxin, mitochondrial isoform X1 n=1 Tax=Leptopilina boulardi TaxID=63433 RepID=UPI0021F6169A|nr:thioredoxin, mitochondrial isoform X1 [Leptopilina boulardi]XP_051160067.1 thioredoxin, mitochondrial isoform X1 [Leptopilina boulardi]